MSWTKRAAETVDKLDRWKKKGVQALGVLIVVGGIWQWASLAVQKTVYVIEEFAPLEVKFNGHVSDYEAHVDTAKDIQKALDADLHTILEQQRVIQVQQGMIIQRLDTVSTEQRWLDCMRLRERDRDAGRPVRECRPFGG